MAQEYLEKAKSNNLPRLPLEGFIDLTYRCNNNCRHCWLRIPPESPENKDELSFKELKNITDEARAMGCRRWSISGGEPMLRPDFAEIFDYITSHFNSYSINTNGTLITPKIARLLKRKGTKMVALYGATREVHDHITRNPGSFEATMRGFSYLKEAGAGFMVQLVPMKDNYYQLKKMIKLADSLSKHQRVGAAWLYLSACGDKQKNAEIMRQRLSPKEVIEMDQPNLSQEERTDKEAAFGCYSANDNGYLLSSCVTGKRDFHIDPYGKMAFCCFIKDPVLRYDLRKGGFKQAWDNFFPSLTNKVKATKEYQENCGYCELRKDCRFCPVYGYLEHRDFNKKAEYLCAIAREKRKFKKGWLKNHRRYFQIADITVQVESDLPIRNDTFHPKFKHFEAKGPSQDMITLRHHFSLPDLEGKDLGKEVYRRSPWAVYKNNGSWIYLGISPVQGDKDLHRVVKFNANHTHAEIYQNKISKEDFLKGKLHSLTMFPTDQILIARILADREGLFMHSCGVIWEGKGLLFVGHSGAGKSTIATMFKGKAEILCDDRIVIRKQPRIADREPQAQFRIYGTWCHGDVPDVSSGSAPLRAIMFLEKAPENRMIPVRDKGEIAKRLLACLVKPFVTVDWWEKTLSLIKSVSDKSPAYVLKFNKNGDELTEMLKRLL